MGKEDFVVDQIKKGVNLAQQIKNLLDGKEVTIFDEEADDDDDEDGDDEEEDAFAVCLLLYLNALRL